MLKAITRKKDVMALQSRNFYKIVQSHNSIQ